MSINLPFVTTNLLIGAIYFWIYFRFNSFLQMADKSVNLTKYMSRSFGFMAIYFVIVAPSASLFLDYPLILNLIHWVSDLFIYLGISQTVISILILLSPSVYFRWKNIVYIFVFAAILTHFYFYFLPSAKHIIINDRSMILAINIPKFINLAPFVFWVIGFFICSIIFFVLAFNFSKGYARKRSILIGLSMLIFSLSYPLSRILYYLDISAISPLFSFLVGIVGLYILTSTSCIISVYSLFYKKPAQNNN